MSVKIFGVADPKIVYEDGTTIDYSVHPLRTAVAVKCNNNFLKPDYKVHTSVLTGRRTVIHKGDYAEFELDVHNVHTTWLDFDQHLAGILAKGKGAVVLFYPNTDSLQAFECIVTEIVPYYTDNDYLEDAYKLVLISVGYVSINTTDDLPEMYSYLVDESDNYMVNEDGDYIVARRTYINNNETPEV